MKKDNYFVRLWRGEAKASPEAPNSPASDFSGGKGDNTHPAESEANYAANNNKRILTIKRADLVDLNGQEFAVDCAQSGELFNFVQRNGAGFDIIKDESGDNADRQIISAVTLLPFMSQKGFYFIKNVKNLSKVRGHLARFGHNVDFSLLKTANGDIDLAIICHKKDSIPKKIFTIWLNDDKKLLEINKRCIESQKIKGYEHKLITLDNCFRDHPYIQQCLNSPFTNKKYIKMSDFLRLHYLYTEGGIYLDADVEILPNKNYDELLKGEFFIGKEFTGFLGTSTIAAAPKHPLILAALDRMVSQFRGDDDKVFESGMELFCDICYQWRDSKINILPQEVFFPFCHENGSVNITDKTISYHHFQKSWVGESRVDK